MQYAKDPNSIKDRYRIGSYSAYDESQMGDEGRSSKFDIDLEDHERLIHAESTLGPINIYRETE